MIGRFLKKVAALSAETCVTLLLVVGAYLLVMFLLNTLFPLGTPLKEWMGRPDTRLHGRGAADPGIDAVLSELVREVRFRRGNSVAWGGAEEGMPLFNHDAVQTLDRAGARISFGDKNRLELGSNSMVLVERVKKQESAGTRRYRVRVQGDIQGSLVSSPKLKLELETAGHVALIGERAVEFRVVTEGVDSSSISIFSGEAELLGPGKTLVITANQGVSLKKGSPAAGPYPLPLPPELEGCRNGAFSYRILPPRLRFTWKGPAGEYRFQLSRWSHFADKVFDVKVNSTLFTTTELQKGSYYWRVSRIEEGRQGRFSAVGRLEIMQRLNPPPLYVLFPEGESPVGAFLLKGSTEPGSRVFLDGQEIPTGYSGEFEREVTLLPGVNLIRLEALDQAGNASYRSRVVYGKVGAAAGEKVSHPQEASPVPPAVKVGAARPQEK